MRACDARITWRLMAIRDSYGDFDGGPLGGCQPDPSCGRACPPSKRRHTTAGNLLFISALRSAIPAGDSHEFWKRSASLAYRHPLTNHPSARAFLALKATVSGRIDMRLVSCALAVVVAAALAGCVSYSSTTRTVPAPATTVVTPPPPPPPVVYVPSD